MKKLSSKMGVRLIACFLVAILIPVLLTGVTVSNKAEQLFSQDMKVTSKQTLQEAEKSFATYLKTLSLPVDLLTRKKEVKHLEDRGDFDENASAIKDALIASLKVTDGSVRCYYATQSGYLFSGHLEEEDGKLKGVKTMEKGIDLTQNEWYQQAIGKEGVNGIYCYFTKPYKDEETGELIFTVSQEVEVDGENYGVVAMDIIRYCYRICAGD